MNGVQIQYTFLQILLNSDSHFTSALNLQNTIPHIQYMIMPSKQAIIAKSFQSQTSS